MKLLRQHWFLISLIVLMAFGFFCAEPFELISKRSWLKWSIVTLTMFLMAWPLEFGRLRRAATRPLAPAVAFTLNMVVIPILIWPLAMLVGPELGPGMIIAACTPCTLASAAVWTRRAGGNDSVAIMVTILTNATCFLVMPFWIMVQTGSEIDAAQLTGIIYKLFFFVVLPIAVAQLARVNRKSAQWATRQKPLLSTLALIGILMMVFLGAVKMGLRLGGQSDIGLGISELLTAAIILLAVHSSVFWFGIYLAGKLGIPRDEQIAVGFSGSQKTLMIGLSIAINLGVSFIPIVLYHAIQLIVDTLFADRLRKNSGSAETMEQQNGPRTSPRQA